MSINHCMSRTTTTPAAQTPAAANPAPLSKSEADDSLFRRPEVPPSSQS